MNIQLWTDLSQIKTTRTYNLALMKLSAYHKARGDLVESYMPLLPCDRLYCSKIFSAEFTDDVSYTAHAAEVMRGGTGYDLVTKLPDDVEHTYPDYDLFNVKDMAVGFLTRGCPNACGFCICSEKEGRQSRVVAELSEFWRGQRKITLLDPNVLAAQPEERERLFQQLAATRAEVRFEQGLDARFINSDTIQLLKMLHIEEFYSAWDLEKFSEPVKRGLLALRKAYASKCYSAFYVYVLVNYNTEFAFDLERVNWLRANGMEPYVMVFNKWETMKTIVVNGRRINNPRYIPGKERFKHLQRAVNNKQLFRAINSLSEYAPLRPYLTA